VLAEVVAAVRAGAKYRAVDPALVAALSARELAAGARPKDAAKAVKNKLHQVAGAYQAEPLQAGAWLAEASRLLAPDPAANKPAAAALAELRPLCRAAMARHASTRERLPILDDFYTQIFADLPPIRSLLDLACGLNPLALSWMDLPEGAAYWACDIYADQADFLNRWFALVGQAGEAFLWDLANNPPPPRAADVVLLLKALPCLQQIDRTIGRRLLDALDAPTLIVSYPAHSLGGRKHGMPDHYAAQFADLVAGKPWRIDTFPFATELVYRIRR
jgi:16S rRNA (guanine(1405)-N(7))-methyltransferase